MEQNMYCFSNKYTIKVKESYLYTLEDFIHTFDSFVFVFHLFLLISTSVVCNEAIDWNKKNHDKKSGQNTDSQSLPKQKQCHSNLKRCTVNICKIFQKFNFEALITAG